jgi:hypothetical protein
MPETERLDEVQVPGVLRLTDERGRSVKVHH